jgi:beta-glucosidase
LPAGAVNTPEHQALAREVAEEAITLLKNEGAVLPLNRAALKTIAVIGPNAAGTILTGGGSSAVEPPQRVTALDGLQAKVGGQVKIEFETGADNFEETPVIALSWLRLPDGSDVGVRGEFFRNADWAGSPEVIRNERRSDFWWFIPAAQNAAEDRVSVRWAGTLTVPESGRYQFELRHMGACRLLLDDQLLLTSHAPDGADNDSSVATATAQLDLVGGQAHTLKIEYLKYVGQTVIHYRLGLAASHKPGHDERLARAVALARRADVALVFVGMPEGFETEGWDRPHLNLPGEQNELVRAIAAANPRTVVVLNVGSPVAMPWLSSVPAVVLAHYPGMEGGHAIANVLFGDVNPSGKLPVSFPQRIEDTPAYYNTSHPGQRSVVYGEGIFVGYRHYDFKDVAPLFPFGHGLSYTTFEYGELRAPTTAKVGQAIQVTLTVKNSGARAGKEVAQVYVRDVAASVARPPKELKGFHKLSLQLGETQTVTFTLDERAFAFYDAHAHRWMVEPGEFEILVGSSSRDVRARASITLQL